MLTNRSEIKIYQLLPLLLLFVSWGYVSAQSSRIDISGKVFDENGDALIGATVQEKGTTNGALTDVDGSFKILASSDAVLTVSFVGYQAQDILVQGRSNIEVSLAFDLSALQEVVVIGYGQQRKKDVTGSLAIVGTDQIEERVSINPLDNLQGRVAGVDIFNASGRPGNTSINVKIRGTGSLATSNQPLYVIDGFIGGDITSLNINDIESMTVLKDASATAIYGFKGANGVVIVTTKKGRKGLQLDLTSNLQVGTLVRVPEVLNSDEYWNVLKAELDADQRALGVSDATFIENYGASYPRLFFADGSPRFDTDWVEESTRQTISQQYYGNIRAGGDNYSASFSAGTQNDQGILQETFSDKNTIRFAGDYTLNKWLKVGGNLTLGTTKTNIIDDYRVGADGLTYAMLFYLPIYPTRYNDGGVVNADDLLNAVGAWDVWYGRTPKDRLSFINNEIEDQQIIQSYFAEFTFAKGLSLRSTYSVQSVGSNRKQHTQKDLDTFVNRTEAFIGESNSEYLQVENLLTYTRDIKKHSFTTLLGASWYKREQFSSNLTSREFDDFFSFNSVGQGTAEPVVNSAFVEREENSFFARMNYAFENRYLLTATGRFDGSSRFGQDNRYAFFPSVAAAWSISNEPFMRSSSMIRELKLRTSYGTIGNDGIGDYRTVSLVDRSGAAFNNVRENAFIPGTIGNSGLQWERTTEYNVGLDVRFWDRITITTDYFNRETDELLDNVLIPAFTGYDDIPANVGSVRNRGIELSVITNNITTGNLFWSTSLNFTKIENEILSLGTDDSDQFFFGQWTIDGINRVGEQPNSFYGYRRLGTWRSDQVAEAALFGRRPGDIKLEDINDDGVIGSEDLIIIGNPNPDFTLNLINTVSYKNWQLTFHIRAVQGGDILDYSIPLNVDRVGYGNTYKKFWDQRWTPENQDTMYPRARKDIRNGLTPDSGWVFDGSFIRGQNLSLSYNLPKSLLQQVNIGSAQVYVNAQNFFVITDYHGYDPEVSSYRVSSAPSNQTADQLQGRELNGYPKPLIVNMGVRVSL